MCVALRTPPALVAAPTAEAFRTRVKAVELEAERLQQEAMFALPLLGNEAADVADAARANVAAYAKMLGVVFPRAAEDTVLANISSMPAAD